MALLFFMMGFFDNGRYSQRRQRFINNVIMLLVALVTLVNIVISTFSNKVIRHSKLIKEFAVRVRLFILGTPYSLNRLQLCAFNASTLI